MKLSYFTFHLICSAFLFIPLKNSCAQSEPWIKSTSKDGAVKVDYRVYNNKDTEGKKQQVLEYESTITADATLAQCVNLLKSVEQHYQFLEDNKESKRIATISDTEWDVYYYFNAIWPLPDYDSVTKVVYKVVNDTQATFTSTANVKAIEDKGVSRLTLNDSKYTLTALNDSQTKVHLWVKVSPTVQAPKWLIKTQFPSLPAKIMTKFAAVAGKQ